MAYHVEIRQGNLLDEPDADFIVNPSNTRLLLGSGVSGAFARACGDALQEAMTAKLKDVGRLSKGDVVSTLPGGCVRFRKVLHAAVMDYNPGAAETAPDLGDIRKILSNISRIIAHESEGQNGIKLVLPMMGTGVGGLDKREVLLIYRDFFSGETATEYKVVLYAHSEGDRKLMQEIFDS